MNIIKIASIGGNCLADIIIKYYLTSQFAQYQSGIQYQEIASPVANTYGFTIDKFDKLLTLDDLLKGEITTAPYIDADNNSCIKYTVNNLNFEILHNEVNDEYKIENKNRLLNLQKNKDDCWFLYSTCNKEHDVQELTPFLKKYLNKIIIIDTYNKEKEFKNFRYYIKYECKEKEWYMLPEEQKTIMYYTITEKIQEIIKSSQSKTYNFEDLF